MDETLEPIFCKWDKLIQEDIDKHSNYEDIRFLDLQYIIVDYKDYEVYEKWLIDNKVSPIYHYPTGYLFYMSTVLVPKETLTND